MYGLLANAGRREDNAALGGQVAHISAAEADLLRQLGGAGSVNPITGLPESWAMGLGPAAVASATSGSSGSSGPGPMGFGPTAVAHGLAALGLGTGSSAPGSTGTGSSVTPANTTKGTTTAQTADGGDGGDGATPFGWTLGEAAAIRGDGFSKGEGGTGEGFQFADTSKKGDVPDAPPFYKYVLDSRDNPIETQDGYLLHKDLPPDAQIRQSDIDTAEWYNDLARKTDTNLDLPSLLLNKVFDANYDGPALDFGPLQLPSWILSIFTDFASKQTPQNVANVRAWLQTPEGKASQMTGNYGALSSFGGTGGSVSSAGGGGVGGNIDTAGTPFTAPGGAPLGILADTQSTPSSTPSTPPADPSGGFTPGVDTVITQDELDLNSLLSQLPAATPTPTPAPEPIQTLIPSTQLAQLAQGGLLPGVENLDEIIQNTII